MCGDVEWSKWQNLKKKLFYAVVRESTPKWSNCYVNMLYVRPEFKLQYWFSLLAITFQIKIIAAATTHLRRLSACNTAFRLG